MRPDGGQPLNNDSDKDDMRERLLNSSSKFDRAGWKWTATNGQVGSLPPGNPSAVFPWAGIHIMRSGWDVDAQWSFFDTGVFGTGHQHSDMLHLSLAAFGQDFLVDAGRYTHEDYFSFAPAIWRGCFRNSFSHNVVLIDHQGQDKGPTLAIQPVKEGKDYLLGKEFDFARGSFDAGFENVNGIASHTRSVTYVHGRFWIVIDAIESDRPRTIQTLRYFAPDCDVLSDDQTLDAKGALGHLRVIPLTGDWQVELVKGQTTPFNQGWYSKTYGEKVPYTTAQCSAAIQGSVTNVWVLLPYSGTKPDESFEATKDDDGAYVITALDQGNQTMQITIPIFAGIPSLEY